MRIFYLRIYFIKQKRDGNVNFALKVLIGFPVVVSKVRNARKYGGDSSVLQTMI